MRTASAPELALLATARVNHHVKIEVTNASGTWKDLTDLSGIDWVDSWEIDGEAIDRQVATAKLWIRRDITTGSKSLAPLMVGSPLNVDDAAAYAPLLDLGRLVRITTAVTAAAVAPVAGDWKEMFLGRINKIDWQASPITVDCSDSFSWIVDTFLEGETPLGSDGGATLESILQFLLSAWPPLPGEPTLYVPVSPAWILPTAFNASMKSLAEMMKDLVDQIAWELRYRYDASGVSRLTLFEPPRTKTTSDATISPSMYRAVRKLALAIDDIRNKVRVNYINTGNSADYTTSPDAVSAGKYGWRYMVLPGGNNIHTAAEAQALGDAAVSDLADPFAEQEVELLYYWPAQLYDLFTFSANADHYDADVQLAVIGVKHAGANGEIITTLTCRGSVAGAYAAWLKRARGDDPTAGTSATSILRVSSTESDDGTQRDFTVIVGGSVDTVHVHYRTVPIDVTGDAFDFSGAETVTESPQLMILRPTAGVVTFSIPHPVRGFKIAGRLVPLVGAPSFAEGASWPFAVDAAPPSVNVKLLPVRTGTTADLSVAVAFGVSDGPVTVDVFEGDVDGTPLLTVTLTGPTTLSPGSYAVLGSRPLPAGKDALFWRVRVTDVSAQAWWFGPASANRDPLPNGAVTVNNYHATPDFVCAYDTDTDAIRITHAGKTKTFDAAALLAAGSVVTWSVGDAFDDASTDSALVVDEARTGYLVEYEGGTTWVTLWDGTLHGTPSNPPTATMRVVKNIGSGTEDLYITPDTQVDEDLLVFYRDGDTTGAPVYQLWSGALVGDGARQVVAGTEVGAGDYWYSGSGSPSSKLAAIPLTRDQVRRVEIGVEGADSGMQAWLPYSLSLLEQPWGESLELLFDQSTRKIRAVFVAGAHTLSAFFEFADNESFTSPTTASGDVADGATLIKEVTLSAAQLGKPWWVRVTPYNAVTLGGLSGAPQTASVAVPAEWTVDGTPTEAAGSGTVTLVVADPGSLFDQTHTDGAITAAISWHVTRAGVYTAPEASTSVPGAGATTGTWTKVVTLLDHNVTVVALGHFIDGSSRVLGSWVFDSNKVSDLASSGVAAVGTTATVTLNWDSDTLVDAAGARYNIDGAGWVTTAVESSVSPLRSQFAVTRTAAKQVILVQAKNALDGAWGNTSTVEVGAFESNGPSLDVVATPGATTYAIAWSGTGTVTVSIDGGAYGTPAASPITGIARPAAGAVPGHYAFKAVLGGQTVTDDIVIPPIDLDTVTPNLSVVPSTPTTTELSLTVTASNPSGGAAPTIVINLVGCTATGYTDGDPVTSGATVVVQRPAWGTTAQATVTFTATIAGGGAEVISRTVQNQVKASFGPTLTVTPTPGASSYSIAWSGSAGTTVNIDGAGYGTPAASPITVTRTSDDIQYVFKASLDGQEVTNSVTIPSLEKDTVMPDLTVVAGTPAATTQPYTITAANAAGGAAPTIKMRLKGTTATSPGPVNYADDTEYTIASGIVITVDRPASTVTTQAHARFWAAISGGGTEEITRTVPAQLALGPSLTLTPTENATTVDIAYTATGTLTYDPNTGSYSTPPGSPITGIARNAAGGATKRYTFKCAADGQEIADTVLVRPQDATTYTPGSGFFTSISQALYSTATDQIDINWGWSGSSAYFEVYVKDGAGAWALATTITNGAVTYRFTSSNNITIDITPTFDIEVYVRATTATGVFIAESVHDTAAYGTA